MKLSFLATACALTGLMLAGCGASQQVSAAPKVVKYSSLPASEQKAIIEVSSHFGDSHPKVVKVTQDLTEPDQRLMYSVNLDGQFSVFGYKSNNLMFSIMGDGSKAWAITNQAGKFNVLSLPLN